MLRSCNKYCNKYFYLNRFKVYIIIYINEWTISSSTTNPLPGRISSNNLFIKDYHYFLAPLLSFTHPFSACKCWEAKKLKGTFMCLKSHHPNWDYPTSSHTCSTWIPFLLFKKYSLYYLLFPWLIMEGQSCSLNNSQQSITRWVELHTKPDRSGYFLS